MYFYFLIVYYVGKCSKTLVDAKEGVQSQNSDKTRSIHFGISQIHKISIERMHGN